MNNESNITKTEFQKWLLTILEDMDGPGFPKSHPIYKIREASPEKQRFNQWLMETEREQKICLQTHNSPYRLTDEQKNGSIQHNHRNTIYYILRR